MSDKEWLILEWIEDNLIDRNLFFLSFYRFLVILLVDLHSIDLSGYSLNLKEYFLDCWNYIDFNRISPGWLKLHHYFQNQEQPRKSKKVISHLDVHLNNILILNNKFLKLIDWEYAVDCDLCFDLSFLFLNNSFDREMEIKFLKRYCFLSNICESFNEMYSRIISWKPWVNYTRMMWYEVRWMQTKNVKYLKLSKSIRKIFNLN